MIFKSGHVYLIDFNRNIIITDDYEIEYKTKDAINEFRNLGHYKLIETEKELIDYLRSGISCDDWCTIKLYSRMKALGLGEAFINEFGEMINDLNKYHTMINLAKECKSKDLLMFMLIKRFGDGE